MKKIILIGYLFLSTTINAQFLNPMQAYSEEVNKVKEVSTLLEMAEENKKHDQHEKREIVLKRLIELRPYSPDLQYELVKAFAMQDKKSEAYNLLIDLQKSGLSLPLNDKELENIKNTKVFEYIQENMDANEETFGEGVKAFEVSHNYSGMLFENLAYDEKGERFLLGSVRSGDIYQYSEKTGFKSFLDKGDPATGPWGVIDLVADNQGDLLWVASATLPHYSGTTQANFGKAMITKYKLSTGELVNNYQMPANNQPVLFNTMHLTESQDLYFINAFSKDLFRIKNGTENVEPLLSLTGLQAIKAITSNSKGTLLYVSDFELGMFVVNLETLQIAPLVRTDKGFFAGIHDLFYDNGDLVAIQSGVKPARLMRYVLKDDLLLINMFPIEASKPEFKSLGNGVLVGDHIYYAANSQWAKVDALGRLLPETTWENLVIMKSPTKYKMEEHMERMQRMEEIKKKRGIQ